MCKAARLYPRGFVFSDKEITLKINHYSHMSILNKYHYYYDNKMTANFYQDEVQESFIIIHGHFLYVDTNAILKSEEILKSLLNFHKTDYEEFLNTLDFIGGRYVIIVGDSNNVELFQDATGMRTVYYSLDHAIVSSHVHHINDITPHEVDSTVKKVQTKLTIFDHTPYTNIKSMMPNLSLNFNTKEKKRFFPRSTNKYYNFNENEKLELVEYLWKEQLNQYNKKYPNIVFSLSGGSDSRVSMAMAKEYLHSMRVFTYTPLEEYSTDNSYFINTLTLDRIIVEQILRDIPLNHRFFYFGKTKNKDIPKETTYALDKNTTRMHGRWLLPFYNSAFPEDDVMHLRSNLMEIGKGYLINSLSKNTISDVEDYVIRQLKKHFTSIEEAREKMAIFFNEGVTTMEYDKALHGYYIIDLYYWESRHGRWHSEILNETDSAFDTFIPFNMRSIIDVCLSFNLYERQTSYVFTELINRNYPILNFYGKNNKLNMYEQVKTKNK